MSDITNNPHDKYFREVFSKKENTIDLLRNALPDKIFSEIDFDNFAYSNKSYVDEDLKDVESDLVVKTRLGNEDCYFYILFEHKSYSDKYSFFQLFKYMFKIWDAEVKDKTGCLTPIIPVLFNQSGHKWTHGDNFSMYFSHPDGLLKDYLPRLKYIVFDLKTLPDDKIYGNVWFVSSILLMKYIRDLQPIFEEIYKLITSNVDPLRDYPDELKTLIIYLFSASSKKDEEYVEQVLKSGKEEDFYMSIAKKYVEIGRQEGEKMGMEKGERKKAIETAKKMKEKKLNVSFIAEITGLSVNEIKKL